MATSNFLAVFIVHDSACNITKQVKLRRLIDMGNPANASKADLAL
jgi:hypothetical protein